MRRVNNYLASVCSRVNRGLVSDRRQLVGDLAVMSDVFDGMVFKAAHFRKARYSYEGRRLV